MTPDKEKTKDEFKEPDVLGEIEPIYTADGKKRVTIKRLDYSGEFDGKPWLSEQIEVIVAKLDRDGDVKAKGKSRIGIPLEIAKGVAKAIESLEKKHPLASNEPTSESLGNEA